VSHSVSHFRSLRDLSPDRLRALLERALKLKEGEKPEVLPLLGKTLAMIFRKQSTRTRISFEVGMFQLGGHAIFLPAENTHLGRGTHSESVADTARVLSRYVDGVLIRTFSQAEVDEFSQHARVPVINGLTDLLHPCQLIADLLTLREEFGSELQSLRVAWVGDGNNMANSWLHAAAMLGFDLTLAVPEGYDPDPEILAFAESKAPVRLVRDPAEAASGAHALCTDAWASMGQEGESNDRRVAFGPYQVSQALMNLTHPEGIFLHCLPAHRGEEVAAEVIDGPRSRVWDEAENRLHAQKALLLTVMS
jgi:ornithine carbamoyltransferase